MAMLLFFPSSHCLDHWSFVRCGAERATETIENSLGVDDIYIHEFIRGGTRPLLSLFTQSLRARAALDVLLIHCGGNDLGGVPSVNLITEKRRTCTTSTCSIQT
ncbi:hypothetical protein ABVT39_027481 [Epinephelus coioides]